MQVSAGDDLWQATFGPSQVRKAVGYSKYIKSYEDNKQQHF